MYLSGLKKNTIVGKDVFLMRKETRARLGRIEVGREKNSKWMGPNEKERRPFANRISGTVRRNYFVKGS